jgi:ATP-dependent Zn protease
MATSGSQTPQAPKKYGKYSIWQWVLFYILIAIIVYGLIYFFFFRNSGGSSNSGGGGLY